MSSISLDPRVLPASRLVKRSATNRPAPCHPLVYRSEELRGRLVEISEEPASGALSYTVALLAMVQSEGQLVCWLTPSSPPFFPPDLAAAGICLDELPIVKSHDPAGLFFALETLLKTNSFGMIVADLGDTPARDAMLGKFQKIVMRNACILVFLTRKPAHLPSLSSLISLRMHISQPSPAQTSFFIHTLKDRNAPPGASREVICHVPRGLR